VNSQSIGEIFNKAIIILVTLFATVIVSQAVDLGVYDFDRTFLSAHTQSIEHVYISWARYKSGVISNAMIQAQSRNRWLLLSLEPWVDSSISRTQGALLADVASGKYDQTILAVCKDIIAAHHPLFVRWGHEMELSSNFGRYPWAGTDAPAYVRAYRRVVTVMKANLPPCTAYFVWSPAGNNNCNTYYPGDDVVDYTGCSLYSWSAYDVPRDYDGSFKAFFDPKYAQLQIHGKPVMVCELGVEKGDNQAAWFAAAKAVFPNYPRLVSVVYFNSRDSVSWWTNGPIPDWSISPTIFHL
jgi:cellulose synthase (UDP-forming)